MHNLGNLPLDLSALNQPVTLAYIAASILFILACPGLSRYESAVKGNITGMAGMVFACAATIVLVLAGELAYDVLVTAVFIALAIGLSGMTGIYRALHIGMTGMPQLIAISNGLVRPVAALVDCNSYPHPDVSSAPLESLHYGEMFLSVFVRTMIFMESTVAELKLQGRIPGRPVLLPTRNWLNPVALIVCLVLTVLFAEHGDPSLVAQACLALTTVVALTLGIHLIIAIGDGDIPVVVSIMNSYSGWASIFTGFLADSDLLIITGAIVGSSGIYLPYLMCEVVNRSFLNVFLGGFGAGMSTAYMHSGGEEGEIRKVDTSMVADPLLGSKCAAITPGYDMAVVQTQYLIAVLVEGLEAHGITVTFGTHPVAGRLLGHTDVLLAEAKVPYNVILEIDEVNDDLGEVDIVLVIRASDTVNLAAGGSGSPIANVSVLRVQDAKRVTVFRRSMATGYTGAQNPPFFGENTSMLLGDTKDNVEAIDRAVETAASLRD